MIYQAVGFIAETLENQGRGSWVGGSVRWEEKIEQEAEEDDRKTERRENNMGQTARMRVTKT